MIEEVRIAAAAWDAMLEHASSAYPNECCGLLVGEASLVMQACATRNLAPDPMRRFRVDPADHFAVIRAARAEGRQVRGAYHSHPASEPAPSETDRAEAFENESFLYVIVRPARGEQEGAIRCYRLTGGNFVQAPLIRVP